LYHSTLGLRVIKKKQKLMRGAYIVEEAAPPAEENLLQGGFRV